MVCGEMSFHIFYLDVLLIQSVYPNYQRKSGLSPSRLKCHLSSVSWFINITFVMKTDIQIIRCAFLSNSNVYINRAHNKTRFIRQPWTKVRIKRLRQPKWRRKVPYTRLSIKCGYVQKKCTWSSFSCALDSFHSLLTSIMKMLYHLSDKNRPSLSRTQLMQRCGTALVFWFHSFILLVSKEKLAKKHYTVIPPQCSRLYNQPFIFITKIMLQPW